LAFCLRHCHRVRREWNRFPEWAIKKRNANELRRYRPGWKWGRSFGRAFSGFWFLILSAAYTYCCLYLYYQTACSGGRSWIDGSAICPANHTRYIIYIYMFIYTYSVFPYHPSGHVFARRIVIFGWVKTKGIYFPPPSTAKHHIIYSVVHDFLPSNNNSSTSFVSGYESSCFLYFSYFIHYINCPFTAVHIRTNTKHIKTTTRPLGRKRVRKNESDTRRGTNEHVRQRFLSWAMETPVSSTPSHVDDRMTRRYITYIYTILMWGWKNNLKNESNVLKSLDTSRLINVQFFYGYHLSFYHFLFSYKIKKFFVFNSL